MRLLHISGDAWDDEPLDISLCEFLGSDLPPYMILSHRWREEEVLFADMPGSDRTIARGKKGYAKLESSCRIALQQKLEYAWLDTCCIDKSSSAELSEAINSMYNYYAQAQICYTFLDDLDQIVFDKHNAFGSCAWFSRGWTLQELIAPQELYFYSATWKPVGSKTSLCRHISVASGIAESVLRDPKALDQVCVSEKMSWAAKRSTTRPEDEAYCLMGLFGVNLPPLYGEGRQKAFRRLQLEIMQTTADHTLFAWHSDTATSDMLAPTVNCFKYGSSYRRIGLEQLSADINVKPDFNMTNFGLHIQLPLWKVPRYGHDLYFAILVCATKSAPWYVGIYLRETKAGPVRRFHRDSFNGSTVVLFPPPEKINLPQVSFGPIWISELDPYSRISGAPSSNPLCPDRIRFFFTANRPKGSVQTYWNGGREVPIHPLMLPAQFAIDGFFNVCNMRHEVIAFGGENSINIAFGILHNKLWFHQTPGNTKATSDETYSELFDAYHFPIGGFWQQPGYNQPAFMDFAARQRVKEFGLETPNSCGRAKITIKLCSFGSNESVIDLVNISLD